MLMCIKCGKLNNPKLNHCDQCGATLQKLAYSMEMTDLEPVYELYYKFVGAADRVLKGKLSLDKYEEFLEFYYERHKQIEDDIRNQEINQDILSEFEEELMAGFSGLDNITDGIATMGEYLDDQDEAILAKGLELIKEGCELIHKAKVLNRERDRKSSAYADIQRIEKSIEL